MKKTPLFFKAIFVLILAFSVSSCEKEESDLIKLDVSQATLNFEDSYQIEAISESPISYSVENEYHAEVSESGFIDVRFVGETSILLKNTEDEKTFNLIVEPKYNLYPEPDVEFGQSKASIIAQFGSDHSPSMVMLGYGDYSTAAPVVLFSFDEQDKLDSYVLLVKSEYSETLANFVIERYMPYGESDGIYAFMNGLDEESATMGVGLDLYSLSYWMVMYIPFGSSDKSTTINEQTGHQKILIEINKFKKQIELK